MPLPLAVRTPQDLVLKSLAERQYLLFNLLAGGKLAYDTGNFAVAATKWEALLRLPGLDPDIDRDHPPPGRRGPGARRWRSRRRRCPWHPATAERRPRWRGARAVPRRVPSQRASAGVTVSGSVTGGGTLGPGGHRAVAEAPRRSHAAPGAGPRKVTPENKTFIPRVLAVPVGSEVDFRNDDVYFHNVFSLGRAQEVRHRPLRGRRASYRQVFTKPGLVELLCNIHASMRGYLYVVDSPYYAQPRPAAPSPSRTCRRADYELEPGTRPAPSPGSRT